MNKFEKLELLFGFSLSLHSISISLVYPSFNFFFFSSFDVTVTGAWSMYHISRKWRYHIFPNLGQWCELLSQLQVHHIWNIPKFLSKCKGNKVMRGCTQMLYAMMTYLYNCLTNNHVDIGPVYRGRYWPIVIRRLQHWHVFVICISVHLYLCNLQITTMSRFSVFSNV